MLEIGDRANVSLQVREESKLISEARPFHSGPSTSGGVRVGLRNSCLGYPPARNTRIGSIFTH